MRFLVSGAVLLLFVAAPALRAADIAVAPGEVAVLENNLCSLGEAIINANDDAATQDDCTAGSNADTIQLAAGSTYTLASAFALDHPLLGNTGLPYVTSVITIKGSGTTIERSAALNCTLNDGMREPSEFRLLHVAASGNLSLQELTLRNGCADEVNIGSGGAIHSLGALTVTESTFTANQAFQYGGAIYGGANIERSTLSANVAQGAGGAVFTDAGPLAFLNSTLSGNSSALDVGGAIAVVNTSLTLDFVTFSDNTAFNNGGAIYALGAEVRSKNSVFHGSSCHGSSTTFAASGANFDSGTSCATAFGSNFTSNATLNLAPLADNGGATQTHALGAGSAALDAVTDCTTLDSAAVAIDQRNSARPKGPQCDAGAFEAELATSPQTIVVDPGTVAIDGGDGLCSLIEAIQNANDTTNGAVHGDCTAGFPGGADTIQLAVGSTYTVTTPFVLDAVDGNTGLPVITSAITIDGNGATIERAASLICAADETAVESEFRLILVQELGQLTLDATTVRNGCADGAQASGGGVSNETGASIIVTGSTLSGNRSTGGGAIAGSAVIERSTLTGNFALAGGGVLLASAGSLTIRNSTLSGNAAEGTGGGVFVMSVPVTLEFVTLSNNTAPSGGGIFAERNPLFGPPVIQAKNVILDNSSCAQGVAVNGTWTAAGANFDSGTTCASLFASNFTANAALDLGPLAGNGGPTQTHALGSNSEALDAATDCTTFDASAITIDQRGASRPFDGDADSTAVCDAGAFEIASTLSIADLPPATEGTGGSPVFTFNISRTGSTMGAVTVQVDTANGTATAGSDFTGIAGATVTIADGENSATVDVSITTDAMDEPNETFTVNLSNAMGAGISDAQATGTIVDDDAAAVLVTPATAEVDETGTTDTFSVVLTSQPAGNVVVTIMNPDTGEASIDTSSLLFTPADWNFAQIVTVTGVDDAAVDGPQTFNLVLTTDDALTTDPSYDPIDPADVAVTNADDETDTDNDGVSDAIDNCVLIANSDQSDIDGDGEGDVCDADDDGDGVDDTVEDGGPNGGDGNDDDIADSRQATVVTLQSATGAGMITLSANCDFENTVAMAEGDLPAGDPAFTYPVGLVEFRLPCAAANVTALYHGLEGWPSGQIYRKYGPVIPGNTSTTSWYTLPNATFDTVTVGADTVARAQFTLTDGALGDDTAVDGIIFDQGGPPLPAAPIPSLGAIGLLALAAILGAVAALILRSN